MKVQNCFRLKFQIHSFIRNLFPEIVPSALKETIEVETVLKGKLRESDPIQTTLPMTSPEDLLKYLFNDVGLELPDEEIRKYWAHCKATNCGWSHMSGGDHIPVALYGDSAKFSAIGEKITCCFLSMPLWFPRAARRRIFLLFALETYRMVGGGQTLFPFYRKIVQTMWKPFDDGIEVEYPDGRTRRLKFVVTELKGDWEWHCESMLLQRSWRNNEFCWRCDASKNHSPTSPSYLDFQDHPDWMNTELTQAQFLGRCIDRGPGRPCALEEFNNDLFETPKMAMYKKGFINN